MRIRGRIVGALAVLAALPTASAEAAGDEARPRLTAVAVDRHDERLRIALALDRRVRFRAALMDAPRRLVVDLPEVAWRADGIPAVPGWLGGMRRGLFRPGRARLIFALDRPLRIARAFTAPGAPGRLPRLVIDLVPTDAAGFAAAAARQAAPRWTRHGRAPEPLRIALDPGHGGRDPGAVVGGMVEKTVVLDFARELAAAIAARPGLDAVLTRTRDAPVPLAARIDLARRAGADLMISLHADRLAEGEAEGLSVYSLGPRSGRRGDRRLTDALLRGDARSDLLAGSDLAGEPDDLARVMVGLARRDTAPGSERLARRLLAELDGSVALLDNRPHRHGAFAVLKAADMPAVLVELGFLDSERDRGRLRSAEWRRRTIAGLIRGIEGWAAGRRVAGQAHPAPANRRDRGNIGPRGNRAPDRRVRTETK